jgi:phosphoribosylanthranilate isomerase
MAKDDINSYRFGRNEEPTDEMLAQIMKEVTETAVQKHKQASEAYFAKLREYAAMQKAKWGPRFESIGK